MLLTLLPMAGWAQELTSANVTIVSKVYNGTAIELPEPVVTYNTTPLTEDTHYTWDGKYYSDEACQTVVASPKNVGTYYVKIIGLSPYSGSPVASFEIQKANLRLTFKDGSTDVANIYKKFGADDPDSEDFGELDVNAADVKAGDTKAGIISITGTGYTYASQNANVAYNATTGPGHPITFTGATLTTDGAKNYNLIQPSVTMLIQRINILAEQGTPSKLSVVKNSAPANYNGSNQAEPTYTVKWNGTTLNKSDNAGRDNKDFDVRYKLGSTSVAANAIHDAGSYTVTITGQNNYEGSVTAEAYNFSIARADLNVGVEDITKPYKGAVYAKGTAATDIRTADINWYFDGLQSGDAAGDIITYDFTVPTTARNAGNHTLTVTATEKSSGSAKNYNIIAENGKLIITPVTGLTIKANKASKTYGPTSASNALVYYNKNNAVVTDKFTVTGVKGSDNYAALEKAIAVTVDPTAINANTYAEGVTVAAVATPTEPDPADYTGGASDAAYLADHAAYEAIVAAQTILANYSNPTYTSNQLTIDPATLRFTPKTISKTYGDADPKTWNVAGTAADFRVRGLLYDDTEATIVTTYPKLARTEGNDVAEYVLSASDAVLAGGNYTPSYDTGKFVINKKTLKITVPDQTFVVSTEANSAVVAQNFTINTTTPLVSGDTADKVFKIKFADGVTSAKYHGTADYDTPAYDATNKKFVAVPQDGNTTENVGWASGIFDAGIVIDVQTGAGKKGGNYEFDYTPGKVIVLAAATDRILIDDSQESVVPEIATANGTNKTVTFTARTFNAEKWNAMVLPFAVTMKDLCTAFNEYVVVDVLNNTTDGNAHFKINLGEIPANTPFLIMTKTAKNLNTVTFTGKTIKYVTTGAPASQTVRDEVGNPYVETDGGVKFVGVYKQASFFAAENIRYMSGGQFYTAKNYTETNPLVQKLGRAYLDMSGTANARPMIYIEEPDGSTTAIDALTMEKVVDNYTKDGWFTANGIKLNDMPTEKGVYIHNGKKIVIK